MMKIVVEVRVHCDKCRTKAMKIAASAQGVNNVSIQGVNRDQLEVIGDGVDSVCLTRDLRKKLGYANIVQVEPVGKPAANAEKTSEKGKEKKPTPIQPPHIIHYPTVPTYYCYPAYPEYCHESPSDGCSVM